MNSHEIWKHPLEELSGTLVLHGTSKPLSFKNVDGTYCLYEQHAIHDNTFVEYEYCLVATGQTFEASNWIYIGTQTMDTKGLTLVFHLFIRAREVRSKNV